MVLPPKLREEFFREKLFMQDKRFWAKKLWGGHSKWED